MMYGTRGATVRLGDSLALDDVSVEVAPGSIVAVVGGDGAGKTTLLRSFVGRVQLASGSVLAPPSEEIGYLPASAGSWPSLSVVQNMDFVGGIYGLAGQDLVERRTALLERAGLLRAQDRLASHLSGGMRRKLGFCMAFLHRPRLLVLDEPSTGVDPVSRVDLWRLVSLAAADGAAVILSTTYLDEAERAATLVALDAGTTLVQGPPSEVLGALEGTVTETSLPRRRDWAWRRGRTFHEYWPEDASSPVGGPPLTPDLEDVVISLSLARRFREGAQG
jgi:ABC-type multidrug transport system ATPase subunit